MGLPAEVLSAGIVVKPAAAAQVGQSPVVAVNLLRDAVTNFIDGSLNWLNGLPANPVTDFMSGALLLFRRDLDGIGANPNELPRRLVSNVSTSQTLVVNTLADSGAGSLRQAILDANAAAGADVITFAVAGTINVVSAALPTITGSTVIDGSTAPGYVDSPTVRIDFQNTDGLMLAPRAAGSRIVGLSLIDAAGAGVTIAASDTTLSGNYIQNNHGAGIYAVGNLRGTIISASTISGNDGSGVWLRWARGITVGGSTGSDVNNIVDNGGWGILATGWSRGSALKGNTVTGNALGQINTKYSTLPSPTVTPPSQILESSDATSIIVTGVRGTGWNNVVLTAGGVKAGETEQKAALFVGSLSGDAATGTTYFLNPEFENVTKSVFYGPNTHRFNPRLIPDGYVQAVGNYIGDRAGQSYAFPQGMIYLGPPNGIGGTWTTINVPSSGSGTVGDVSACQGRSAGCSVAGTIAHSTMGDLVVGNYDLTLDGQAQDPTTVNAFIYNTATQKFTLLGTNGDPFGALNNYTTIYGVWQVGGQNSPLYTLAGGSGQAGLETGQRGFVVSYNASTGEYGTPSYYTPLDSGVNVHFEGITQVPGGFSLAGEALGSKGLTKFAAFIPTSIPVLPFLRNVDTIRYGSAVWAQIDFDASPVCSSGCLTTTANTIYENKLMGAFVTTEPGALPQTYLSTLTGRFGLLPWWYR